jgi:penicillin-binding protein 1A
MANRELSRSNQRNHPKRSKSAPTKRPKKKRHLFLKTILGLFILGIVGLAAGLGLFIYYAHSAPAISDSKLSATVSSKLYDSDGNLFEDLGAETRVEVSATDVPQTLADAVVSVEDKRFYSHIGVDPVRIIGSLFHNVSSGGLQGGSTLTQQLIKLSYFSTKASDQTLKRKAQEAWLAIQVERKKSKQEILTYYINKVYMANGIYGMETASETYFGKKLDKLTLAQSALLAGMPQAPSAYDPYQHPEAAKQRRDTVLYTMLDNKKITKAEYTAAKATPITDGLQTLSTDNSQRKIVDNYVKEVISEVKEKTGKDIYTDGLSIYTNLDLDEQTKLYNIVNTDDYVTYPDSDMQVAATLVDPKTGKVKAQIGGRHIADNVYLGNNLAVNTTRDFGSTVKPITDYGPAIEYLKKSTATTISDTAYDYPGTDIAVNDWDNDYMGSISLRTALYESRNIPAVKMLEEVGKEKSAAFLGKLGIQYKTLEYSNAISSSTTQDGTKYGISTLKMAAAYSAFANGGTYYEPQYINKIVYQDGSEQDFSSSGTKAMEPYTAFMITDILKDVIDKNSMGQNAQIDGLYQAGKTGTSNYTDDELAQIEAKGIYATGSISPDVMFTGYTQNYALSVWTGYNERLTPIYGNGNYVASDVYREMMQYVSADVSNDDWTAPDDVVKSGNEYYVKGSSAYSAQTSSSKAAAAYYSSSVEKAASSASAAASTPSSTVQATEPSTSSTQSAVESASTTSSSSAVENSVASSSAGAAETPASSSAASSVAPVTP